MKLALATWNGWMAPVFDVSRQVLILDISDGKATARRQEVLPGTDPATQAERLAGLEPQTLLCGAISKPLADRLAVKGVQVIPFIAGEADQVLAAYLAGTLAGPAWSMPGCCGRRGQFRGGARGRGCRRGQRDGVQ